MYRGSDSVESSLFSSTIKCSILKTSRRTTTVGSKIIWALVIIIAILLWFEYHFFLISCLFWVVLIVKIDLINIYFMKLHWYEFCVTNYLKSSNNFTAGCRTGSYTLVNIQNCVTCLWTSFRSHWKTVTHRLIATLNTTNK